MLIIGENIFDKIIPNLNQYKLGLFRIDGFVSAISKNYKRKNLK